MKRAILMAALAAFILSGSVRASAQVVDRDIPTVNASSLRLNVSGSVRIIPVAGLRSVKLHVEDYGPKTPPLRVTTARTGARLTISVTGPSQSVLPFGATGYELNVSYPASMKLDLREFAGRVHVDRVTAPMQVYNANGSIIVDDAASALTAESDSGDVTVSSAHGMVELTCGDGNAVATLARNWSGNLVRMESSNGNLTLNVPAAFRARFDVSSAGGTVRNPLHSTPHAPLVFMLTQQGSATVNVAP